MHMQFNLSPEETMAMPGTSQRERLIPAEPHHDIHKHKLSPATGTPQSRRTHRCFSPPIPVYSGRYGQILSF